MSLLMGSMSFFGILTNVDYFATFILFSFAGIYFTMGHFAKKRLSITILIPFVLIVCTQMGYFLILEQRFTPLPILVGGIIIYEAIQDYRNLVKKENIQQTGDS
jgi:hypothetical protein